MNLGYLLLLVVFAADAEIGPLPFYFEPNLGQSAPGVQFIGRGGQATVLLESGNSTVLLPGGDAVRMRLIGAKAKAVGSLMQPQPGVSAYYTSADPAKRLGRVPHLGRAHYAEVYPGIDVTYYGNPGNLEFDFLIKPGADPGRIRLAFDRPPLIEPSGDLMAGGLRYRKPAAYQTERGRKVFVEAGYRMTPGGIAFRLGAYDRSRPLTIDPVVVYTTRYAGVSDAATLTLAVDTDGAIYLGGTSPNPAFPAPNPATRAGDAFIVKLNPAAGNNIPTLAYALFIGGDYVSKLAVNGTGAVFATGMVRANRHYYYPSTNAYQQPGGGSDVFVAKVNPHSGGSVTIAYATTLGGSGDETPGGIAADSAGAAYVTGETSSPNFPAVNGLRSVLSGPTDAFAVKLRPYSGSGNVELAYSTYLGGSSEDRAYGIGIDSAGAAYIAGDTSSADFPAVRAWQTFQGTLNAFVAKLNPHGAGPVSLDYSTLLSGAGPFATTFGASPIAVDAAGAAYVGLHGPFTPTNGITSPILSESPALSWVARLAPHSGSGNAVLSYLTQVPDIYLGSDTIVSDASGRVTICGRETVYTVLFAIAPYLGGNAAKAWETRLFQTRQPISCAAGLSGETYLVREGDLSKLTDPAVGTPVPIVIGSSPVAGMQFTVSGANCNLGGKTTPASFTLPFGVPCSFTVPAGQMISPGIRASLRSWSVGLSQLNPLTIQGGDVDLLGMNTSREFELTATVQPPGAGQVVKTGTSQAAAGWYPETTGTVAVSAAPNLCYVFDSWRGAATGSNASINLSLNGPLSLTAWFRLWENAGARLSARLGAVRYDIRTGRYMQAVWITNNTSSALIAGIAADNLPAGIQMVNATATTSCTPPAGAPFRLVGTVPAGATYPFTIEFTKPAGVPLSFSARTITLGPAQLP